LISIKKDVELTKLLISQRVEDFVLCLSEKEKESIELLKSINTLHIAVDTGLNFSEGTHVINNEITISKIAGKHLFQLD
jgi:hypothetical protein